VCNEEDFARYETMMRTVAPAGGCCVRLNMELCTKAADTDCEFESWQTSSEFTRDSVQVSTGVDTRRFLPLSFTARVTVGNLHEQTTASGSSTAHVLHGRTCQIQYLKITGFDPSAYVTQHWQSSSALVFTSLAVTDALKRLRLLHIHLHKIWLV
jgi:hypothetical protein